MVCMFVRFLCVCMFLRPPWLSVRWRRWGLGLLNWTWGEGGGGAPAEVSFKRFKRSTSACSMSDSCYVSWRPREENQKRGKPCSSRHKTRKIGKCFLRTEKLYFNLGSFRLLTNLITLRKKRRKTVLTTFFPFFVLFWLPPAPLLGGRHRWAKNGEVTNVIFKRGVSSLAGTTQELPSKCQSGATERWPSTASRLGKGD